MSIDQDLENLAIKTTKLELAIRRKLRILLLLKKNEPKKAREAIDFLRTKYVINQDVADMFYLSNMNTEYLNLLTTFEKVLDDKR